MNKRITKRLLAAVAVVSFFVFGANAQYFGDYVSATTAGETIDTVTVGTQTGFYAEPDPYYSPSYNTATNTGLGANQLWDWTITPATGTASGTEATSGNYLQVLGDTMNYLEVVWGAGTGTVTLDVAERNSSTTCAGSTQSITVQVIGTPTVTYSADAANGAAVGGIIGTDISVCESDADRLNDIVQLAFTQAGITGNPSYKAQYTITVDTLTIGTGVPVTLATESFTAAGGTQVSSNAATLNLAQPVDHGDGAGFVCITNAGGDKRGTVYTYTIAGVNDRISRKCDFLSNTTNVAAGWSWYDTTAETIAVTVNPAPVTGPIYHISNMWAN